jgi:hypothetical protein
LIGSYVVHDLIAQCHRVTILARADGGRVLINWVTETRDEGSVEETSTDGCPASLA